MSSGTSGAANAVAAPGAAAPPQRRTAVSTAAAAAAAAPASSEMITVDVDLGDRSYPIYIGAGLLARGELLRRHVPGKRVLIVTNKTVAPLYLDRCAFCFVFVVAPCGSIWPSSVHAPTCSTRV